MSNEVVGTFVDAIYAIAITLLALELPSELDTGGSWVTFANTLGEYALAFAILFVFWLDHRRINAHIPEYTRPLLALTGAALLCVCLIPTATLLVFKYGDDVTVLGLSESLLARGTWSSSEMVDLFYLVVVLTADGALLSIARLGLCASAEELGGQVRTAKTTTSLLLLVVALLSLLLPVENRYFLLVLPVAVFFEQELARVFQRCRIGVGV